MFFLCLNIMYIFYTELISHDMIEIAFSISFVLDRNFIYVMYNLQSFKFNANM